MRIFLRRTKNKTPSSLPKKKTDISHAGFAKYPTNPPGTNEISRCTKYTSTKTRAI
ncbi:hypothetical protein BGZ63DRAFT_162319 [Mariannaea sp. PMI_226]|nr:hypothetical protein BGZ63DRAFT_162319 [Mariannaea sp. PMI_226]